MTVCYAPRGLDDEQLRLKKCGPGSSWVIISPSDRESLPSSKWTGSVLTHQSIATGRKSGHRTLLELECSTACIAQYVQSRISGYSLLAVWLPY